MIKSFKDRRLRRLYEKGESRKLPPEMVDRIESILSRLDVMENIRDMRLSYLRLHSLKGKRKGQWAVTVKDNYRITFRFMDGHVRDVDFDDYH
ncbi:MAG: type II toxin-antitoxin system RelE/ParE family toxin [Hyphomicrobiales bacterium]|nr:type II toxin-antitoxin system RelE/ParE family toxin [Hyphomicrobiales bacterium]